MQEKNLEPASLSQLLRESYLAETRPHHKHSEMSHMDTSPCHLVYGTHAGKSEDIGGQDDFPDLSAFLSQEELHKSVSLAQQAIDQGPQEEREEENRHSVQITAINPASEKKKFPLSQPLPSDRQTPQPVPKENVMRSSRSPKEPHRDFQRQIRNTPYGPETQSKKEFLNKAADFIEELSSLFKANSSKRIRPRACKAHRSRYQAKTQSDSAVFALSTDDRERPIPSYSNQQDVQSDDGLEAAELCAEKDSVAVEGCDPGVVEGCASQPEQLEQPVMEPPRFIQKLKSREVPEGSKVQLDCIVRGFPVPEVRWFCEGKELEDSPDIQILSDGELHSLIIAEAFEEDTGRYSCFASNFYGTDSTSAEIYIEGASSSDSDGEQNFVNVTKVPKKTSLSLPVLPPSASAEPVSEVDSLSGLPPTRPPPVQYPAPEGSTSPPLSKESTPPPQPKETTSPPLPEGSKSPPVQDYPPLPVQEDFTQLPVQEYTPLPVQEGSILQPLHLVLPQSALQEGENFNCYPQGLDGRPLMAAPVFTKSLQDVNAFESQLVVLECRVKGVPSPRVDWYREGTLIDDSPDFRILQKKDICSLVIAEVFPEDSGTFTCTASNKYGTVSSIAYLKVKGNESSKVNSTAVSKTAAESVKNKAPGIISPDLPRSCLKPQLDGTELNHHEPRSSIFPPSPLISGQKPKVELTLINHSDAEQSSSLKGSEVGSFGHQNECPSSILVSDFPTYGLKPKLEGFGGNSTVPSSSNLPPDSIGSILKAQVEGSFNSQDELKPSVTSADPGVCLKPKAEGTVANHTEPRSSILAPEALSSCLKPKLEGVLVNHNEPRSSSRVGLRVHFKLPEDEAESDTSSEESSSMQKMSCSQPHGDLPTALPNKEPPPVLAKPKLDPVQLQFLHNQVLLEQQQGGPQTQPEESPWSPAPPQEPQPAPMNLYMPVPHTSPTTSTNMTQSFNYTRPKEFIAAQSLSPVSSLSSTESPVPMLTAMAAQLPHKLFMEPSVSALPPAVNQYTQSPRLFSTRVLQSPTSPPAFVSSPPPLPPTHLPSTFPLRPQSPPQTPSPIPGSSTPSPIQNPVAFLSSVLPSLPTSPPTNAMGLPRSAPAVPPQGILKKLPRTLRSVSDDEIYDSKETILHDLEKKLRFKEDSAHHVQQKPAYERKTSGRLLGPNNPATAFKYDEVQECSPFQEYKVSNFEQRLMSEIEFRLERTPVEESDDEIQHDEIPTGKCIAPIFDKKLKNFRVMEGVPVTFTCKVVGIPIPKVYWFKDGKQILKKADHYKKIREGDGTCALHIEATNNDDDGNYTVMAANPQGRISCSGHLIVQTGPVRNRLAPMIHSQRVRSRVQEVEDGEPIQERFFRPHFLQAPGDMLAHEGRLCRLDCKVSGLPNPELMWLLDGKPILPDIYHRMLVRENGIHSLLIDPLKQSDAGTYTCIATNKAGQNSFSLELSVVEKEVKKAPMFLEKLQNIGIAEGAPVRLECRIVGMPPPNIYWKKDNDTISPSKERFSMHQDSTGYVCLLIQPSRKEDAGWYTVSAKNQAGIISCTARLDIYAQWHQQISLPMRNVRPAGSRYAALTSQGLDIMSAFPSTDSDPILFSSSPTEAVLESEEL
ncbi:myopalladin-like isoform X2 [Megalops cyprinoides]|uniref:myopalladin-like isoform X2 n=1 Tax=Megalops cyprinoides TaxID=118141 RepID=UPI0018649FE4|nr:myopalladin-like isoform X2 [Megalops cyprinoides]